MGAKSSKGNNGATNADSKSNNNNNETHMLTLDWQQLTEVPAHVFVQTELESLVMVRERSNHAHATPPSHAVHAHHTHRSHTNAYAGLQQADSDSR